GMLVNLLLWSTNIGDVRHRMSSSSACVGGRRPVLGDLGSSGRGGARRTNEITKSAPGIVVRRHAEGGGDRARSGRPRRGRKRRGASTRLAPTVRSRALS